MKKFLPLMVLAIVMLFGCAKEETTPQMEESGDYVFKVDGDNSAWEFVTMEEPVTSSVAPRDNQGNSAHMHGDFGPNLPGLSGVFSGTQNNGGTHGSATLTTTRSGSFGGPPVVKTYTLETECVMVEGIEAVYGGIITEMSSPNPPFLPQVGDYMYFKVIDNGQGNNAPADQYHGFIRFSKTSKCDVWTPGSTAWPATFFGFPMVNDIPEPGSVKVNN